MAPWSTLTLEGREKHSTGRRPPRERSTCISFNRLGWCVSPKQFTCPSFLHSDSQESSKLTHSLPPRTYKHTPTHKHARTYIFMHTTKARQTSFQLPAYPSSSTADSPEPLALAPACFPGQSSPVSTRGKGRGLPRMPGHWGSLDWISP